MTETLLNSAETPSGKGAGDENFPVGSILLPKRLRPHVAVFYAYARAIDDVADNPDLSPDEKVRRLDGFDKALLEQNDDPAYDKAHRIRESLAATNVPVQHCRDLISAFKQDAVKLRYADWAELIGYCDRSAAPVGRYLLDLHGESRDGYPANDALCNTLQVLNHLQDCAEDYRTLDRVYLPGDWMAAEGVTVEALTAPALSQGLRRVIDRCLDDTDALIAHARTLPGRLRNRRLAMESAAIVNIAARLSAHLRRRDPLAERVELSKPEYLWCCVKGAARTFI
ncbi:MAG: squalene synthase HpnC [Alphaproteobacteria bacterium]|nr:squalene synthase HpnC [Alphaproteobacteria bacterium]